MTPFQNEVHVSACLSPLDYGVFFLVLFATFLFVLFGNSLAKKEGQKKSFLDYMLMGRRLSLPMFTMTLVATWYGGIFGVTEIAFKSGLFNFLSQGIFWYVSYLIFAFFLVDKIKASNAITLPDLAGKLFGPKSKIIAGIFNFFNVVPISYTISLGILISSVTGLSFIHSCLAGVLFSCCYSFFGGFRAVVFSDVFQFFIMCSSVAMVFFFSLGNFGFSFLFEKLPPSHFDLTGGHSLSSTFAWGFIALTTLVDPNFYQRCFAAESTQTARKGILLATMIWCLFDLCTTFGAMYAAAVIPQAKPGEAYLMYSLQILPNGLKGFFLAGLVATILSTVDSYLFIASNTLSYDLAPKAFKKSLLLSKISILATGLLSVFMGSLFSGSIKLAWKTLGSYSAGCMLFPMVLRIFFGVSISDRLFCTSTFFSAATITLWRIYGSPELDSLYIGLLVSSLCLFGGKFSFSFFLIKKIKTS